MCKAKGKNTYVKINDKFTLVYDKYCMWIMEEKTHEKTRKVGKQQVIKGDRYSERVSGYHRTFAELINSLELRLNLRIDGIETLEQLAEKQEQMHEEIRELCRGLKDISELVRDME